MFRPNLIVVALVGAACSVYVLLPANARAGTATNGTLYFDTFQIKDPFSSTVFANATVQSVQFNYNGGSTAGSFGLSGQSLIKDLGSSGNADGLIFGPNGNLLIGGSTTGNIVQVTTGGTIVGSVAINPSGTNPYHLSLSPDGNTIYSGGETTIFGGDSPGPLGVTPFFSTGAAQTVTGSDTGITQIAFDPSGNAYYTSSAFQGTGDFGTINLSTFVTTSKITSLPAAHGITYDPFTHDLIVAGAGHITQIDPATFNVISDLDITSQVNTPLDQVTVDGHGHVFASSNGTVDVTTGTVSATGQLVFIDMTGGAHTLTDASNFTSINNLANALDDIAPLSGPGSVPEPSGLAVVAMASLLAIRRRSAC